jgi:hypothetical protein
MICAVCATFLCEAINGVILKVEKLEGKKHFEK